MIDELIKSSANSPAIGGTGSGGGTRRIHFAPSIPPRRDWRRITPWCDRLAKRLEETFCEVVSD